jgi:hypothetical protein
LTGARRFAIPASVAKTALAALGIAACDMAPITGKLCPCPSGYSCCDVENVCLPDGQICAGAFAWPPATTPTTPLPMDGTVFAMSQYSSGVADPQVLELAPDMVVRGWSTWDLDGFSAGDYDTAYLDACHQANIRFMGGANLASLFRDQMATQADLEDFATRNARGDMVSHTGDVYPDLYWATLANPRVRARAVQLGEMQIDLGVDGLQFVALDSDFGGISYLGNEGFDKYHLADFNAYLLAKFPADTDFAALFSMTPDNVLRRDRRAGDLMGNFNYHNYLRDRDLLASPLSLVDNPLAGEWGTVAGGRASINPHNFLESEGPYRLWRQIVDELHAYARNRGRDVLINATGVYPFVDFQAVGLWANGEDAADFTYYVPVKNGRLDGTVTLQPAFAGIVARAQAVAPTAPIVVFLDGDWPLYDALTPAERQDYWRLYTAEAYANGVFFAFDLYSPGDPQHTASDLGLMPLFKSLAGFYRAHAGLYHGVARSAASATTSLASAMVAVSDEADPLDGTRLRRRIVHIVNHEYRGGIVAQPPGAVTVTISSSLAPTTVTLASPDQAADQPLSYSYAGGQISLQLPVFVAYDVVIVSY